VLEHALRQAIGESSRLAGGDTAPLRLVNGAAVSLAGLVAVIVVVRTRREFVIVTFQKPERTRALHADLVRYQDRK
jgi:hypothetical protein